MASQANGSTDHRIRLSALVERFNSVLYPFDLMFLFDRLPDAGWIVGDRIDEAAEESARIKAPVKGNVRLRIDQASKTLGVTGRDPAEVLAGYRELRTLALETAGALNVHTDYIEFRYIGELTSKYPPPEALSRWWQQSKNALSLGGILDEFLPGDAPMGPYGLRFAPAGLDANRLNWAELTLTPVNNTGQRDYHFDLLFRNVQSDLVERVAETCVEIVNRIVSVVEERA